MLLCAVLQKWLCDLRLPIRLLQVYLLSTQSHIHDSRVGKGGCSIVLHCGTFACSSCIDACLNPQPLRFCEPLAKQAYLGDVGRGSNNVALKACDVTSPVAPLPHVCHYYATGCC